MLVSEAHPGVSKGVRWSPMGTMGVFLAFGYFYHWQQPVFWVTVQRIAWLHNDS